MIRLNLLGSLDLRREGVEVRSVLSQPRRLALLTHLALANGGGFQSRDSLLALFWPEADAERARNSLRQSLHQLRRSLGEEVVIGRGDREVGLNSAVLWCDASAFDAAIVGGDLEEALALYRGDLLPGFHIDDAPEVERWLDDERSRRRTAAVSAALTLAERDRGTGEWRAVAAWARTARSLEPLAEAPVRMLLTALQRTGETAAALEAFIEFSRRLEQELGVQPSQDLAQLAGEIRTAASAPARLEVSVLQPEAATPARPDALESTEVPDRQDQDAALSSGPYDPSSAEPRTVGKDGSRQLWPRLFGEWPLASAAVLVLLLGMGAYAGLAERGELRPTTVAEAGESPSIAVLPFVNMSGDPERDYFSDGLAEELLNVLAQIPELRVAARTSSFRFRGNDVPIDSIGKLLRVDHVLEGSVREEGSQLRITAQLIDARTGYHLWSNTYDRPARDLFAVQDEISRAIVSVLKLRLSTPSGSPLVRTETIDPEAHALVMKGSHLLGRRATPEGMNQAASFYEQAIARDPDYARAHAGLAAVLQNQAYRRYVPPAEGYARARAAARRALELDAAQIRAHTVLARVAELHDRDFAAAEEHYRRAAELNPSSTGYLAPRAFLLLRLGRTQEAIDLGNTYRRLEPSHVSAYTNLGAIYGYARRFERAIDALHSALELEPEHSSALINLAFTYSYLGRHDEAVRAAERARAVRENDQYALAAAGYALGRAGRSAEAGEALRLLRGLPDASAYLQAAVLAGLDRHDEAFVLLDRALVAGEDAIVDLGIDPSFDPLRRDPRMTALLRRAGLPVPR